MTPSFTAFSLVLSHEKTKTIRVEKNNALTNNDMPRAGFNLNQETLNLHNLSAQATVIEDFLK